MLQHSEKSTTFVPSKSNNTRRAAQLDKLCTENMTQQEVKSILSANRDLVINYYAENCAPRNKFYDIKWFMGRVLVNAEISWAKRKNIAEKDVMAVIKSVIKSNPQLLKGYMSNWEKAVRYHGYDLAKKIADCK